MPATAISSLSALEDAVRLLCAGLDPDQVPAGEVDITHARLARIERIVAGARMRLARRVDEVGAWRAAGERSAAHAIARAAGCSVTRARTELDTSLRLPRCSATERAVASGELSLEQAAAVADAATHNPGSEDRLLRCASRSSLGELRRESARAKAAGDRDALARHARIHRERFLRYRVTADGAGEIHYHGTVDACAEIMAAVGAHADRIFRSARTGGIRDTFEQYQADALLAMSRASVGGDGDKPVPATLMFRIDWPAFVRGYPVDGEVCEIAGVGSVPVAVVDDMIATGDPFLAAVVTRGDDVVNVAHLGRKARAVQSTALQWRDPACMREGCNQTAHLHTDHRADWAETHHTALRELDRLCPYDHELKTVHGWALVTGTGKRPLVPPEHPDHPARQPRPGADPP